MYLTQRIIRCKISPFEEIWLNTLSGAVDRIGKAELAAINGIVDNTLPHAEKLRDQLVSRGYLYADRQSENVAFLDLVRHYRETDTKRLVNLIACPTYACNLRCIYCFEHHLKQPARQALMQADAVECLWDAFRQIMRNDQSRQYSFGLFGGEPLLPATSSLVTRLFELAESEWLPINIATNGVYAANFLELFRQHRSHIDEIQITLDGPQQIHDSRRPDPRGAGSYEAIVNSIDRMLQAKIRVSLRINVDVSTVAELPRLAEIMHQKGWLESPQLSCSLAPIQDHTGSGLIPNVMPNDILLASLFDIYNQNPECEAIFGLRGFPVIAQIAALLAGNVSEPRLSHCEATQGGFWLAGPDGFLYACPETIGQADLAIGRFMPELEVFHNKRQLWLEHDAGSMDSCHKCKFTTLCGGGCAYASAVRGTIARRPVCEENMEESIKVFLSRTALRL